jgi:hypothetical protein
MPDQVQDISISNAASALLYPETTEAVLSQLKASGQIV